MTAPTVPVVPEAGVQAERWLPLERAADVGACGGKAVNLGRMLRAGLPVPAGIVLTVHALREFLDGSDLAPRILALESRMKEAADWSLLAQAESQVRSWFDAAPLPESLLRSLRGIAFELPGDGPLAVRSSAVGEDAARASCAGLMDSVLGIERCAPLESAIKRVWASRWSARALAYMRGGRVSLGGIAVIVQVQIAPRSAGVLFTRSPAPGRDHEMLIEYCEGLADKLVAGEITPACLAIDRAHRTARGDASSAASALDDDAVDALATAALAAERLFGSPQDIEWALDGTGRIWLVQSRPITAQAAASGRRHVVWSNANVNENFPEPISPLLYSVVAPGYSRYFANLGRAFGLTRWRMDRMAGDLAAIVGVHAGRLYYNLSAIHAVLRQAPFGARLVAWFDEFTGAAHPFECAPQRDPGFVCSLRAAIELGRIAAKTAWQYLFIERRLRRFEARIDAFAAQSTPAHLPHMDLLRLRDLLRGFVDIRLHRWTDASLADAAAMVCYGSLKAVVGRALPGADTAAMHNALLQGLSGLKSAEPVGELWALAERVRSNGALSALFGTASVTAIAERLASEPRFADFQDAFHAYLERWGFRCSGELMLTVPSFQERPEALLEIVRSYAARADAAPEKKLAEQRCVRRETTRAVMAAARTRPLLRPWPWPSHASILAPVLRATQASIGLRERARLKQALLYSRLRLIALEVGARLVEAGTLRMREDVFFLSVAELDELLSGRAMFPQGVSALVALRREAHARFAEQRPPDILVAAEGKYPSTLRPAGPAGGSGDALRGASVCGGVATGKAKVLTDVGQTRELHSADILVTRQTDPGWAPAFVTIAALVLERGGMLSHGAILAREYGIPTVVGIAGATERIGHGATIRVDGDRGEVHVLAAG